jgi:hypothetical protein
MGSVRKRGQEWDNMDPSTFLLKLKRLSPFPEPPNRE